MKCVLPIFLSGLLALGFCACKPPAARAPKDPARPGDQAGKPGQAEPAGPAKPETKPGPGAVASRPTDPSPRPEPEPVIDDPDAEPDWKARYAELQALLAPRFIPPALGKTLTVMFKSGDTKSGTLTGLEGDTLTMEMPEGTVSFGRTMLADRSRIKIFRDDAVKYAAMRRLRAEKSGWEKSQELRRLEEQRQLALKARQKKDPLTAAERQHLRPVNDPNDRSVWQVRDYLKGHLRNYPETRFLKWYPVEKHKLGWTVRVKYQTPTESFGMAEERMMFFMNENGTVYRHAGYKEAPGETAQRR